MGKKGIYNRLIAISTNLSPFVSTNMNGYKILFLYFIVTELYFRLKNILDKLFWTNFK